MHRDKSYAATSIVEPQMLLDIQSSEDIPQLQLNSLSQTVKRAQETAINISLTEAVRHLGSLAHPLPAEVLALGKRWSPSSQSALSFMQQSSKAQQANKIELTQGNVDKAIGFLNGLYRETFEKIDLLLIECGDYKVSHEKMVAQLDEASKRVIVEINSLSGERSENEGIIETKTRQMNDQNAQFGYERARCEKTKSIYESEIAILTKDVEGVKTLQALATKCDGKTLFLQKFRKLRTKNVKLAVKGLISSVHAEGPFGGGDFGGEEFSDFDESERGDEMDEGPIKGDPMDLPDESCMGGSCAFEGAKMSCGNFVAKLNEIYGIVQDELDAKVAVVQKHVDACEHVLHEMHMEIEETRNSLTQANTRFAEVSAYLSGLSLQRNMQGRERHDICKAMRLKYKSCHKEYEALEKQLCTLVTVRQNLHKQQGGGATGPTAVIRDCEVGEWVAGPCSQPCHGGNGVPVTPGFMQLTRYIVMNKGPYGAPCPPLMMQMDCNAVPCPVDCRMSEWSEWGECTKECGGGSHLKTRSVLVEPTGGGEMCPNKAQRKTCNVESCDVDCGLTEWTAWGPCTRACRAYEHSEPGRMYRKRNIHTPVKGKGKCPMPHSESRLQFQSCNFDPCPEVIKCDADLDLVMLLDGGGSLIMKESFDAQINFAKYMVDNSTLSGNADIDKPAEGMRFGFIHYSTGAKTLSALSGVKDDLDKALTGATWDAKGADVGEAIHQAKRVFRYAGGGAKNRFSTLVLFTDGSPSRASLAVEAARELRDSGVRLVVALVSIPLRGEQRFKLEQKACELASQPCADNMLIFSSWANVEAEARRLMVGLCPVIESDLV